jgi:anhydro-N-acetylmuramic acid kinase
LLHRALVEGAALTDRVSRPGVLREADEFVTAVHAQVVEKFLNDEAIDRQEISVVGFHGQTVIHKPQHKLTVQIGDGGALAARLRSPVACDFRQADIMAGGQGAPIVPVFHQAIARDLAHPHPIAVLNIGGVANVTYVDGGDPVACDTGPGNALIDDFMRARTGASYDNHGDVAATGKPDQDFIDGMLAHPFFLARPPKSLDRNACAFANIGLPHFSVPDGAATLSLLTVKAVARIVPLLPSPPRAWIVAGGGARNNTLMAMLASELAPATVETADAAGWSADALEAQAFAFLAVRAMTGKPLTFPTTTAAPRAMTGGVLKKPANRD